MIAPILKVWKQRTWNKEREIYHNTQWPTIPRLSTCDLSAFIKNLLFILSLPIASFTILDCQILGVSKAEGAKHLQFLIFVLKILGNGLYVFNFIKHCLLFPKFVLKDQLLLNFKGFVFNIDFWTYPQIISFTWSGEGLGTYYQAFQVILILSQVEISE